jgi:DedD protein
MEEKNELTDIMLDKSGGRSSGAKKTALMVAALAVVLILAIVVMNIISGSKNENLPQPILPPEPDLYERMEVENDPLFEPVDMETKDTLGDEQFDEITKKLKAQSLEDVEPRMPSLAEPEPAIVAPQPRVESKPEVAKSKPVASGQKAGSGFYIQVGSFQKYKPNNKFLTNINKKGYTYYFHRVTINGAALNKVLVGPYQSRTDAKNNLAKVRSDLEKNAYILKIN